MKMTGGCLLTVNSADQSVSPFSVGGGGQLIYPTTLRQPIGSTSLTSINGNGSYVYLTDSVNGASTNYIYPFSIGSNCNLQPVTGGAVANLSGQINPSYSMLDNSGKYLYVLNQTNLNTTSPQPTSSISAWTLNTATGQLQPLSGAPFTVGSGPVCMVEETSNQYIYISSHNDGVVTGKVIDPTTGDISDLTRGATFKATGQATCLVVSGAVS